MSTDKFPLLFTLNGSTRHEVLLISPSHVTLDGLKHEILQISASSPNCEEFMSKYKSAPKPKEDTEAGHGEQKDKMSIKVKWSSQTHDPKIWPASTIVTESNFEAVLSMIGASGVGRDVMEVTVS